jgi:predicted chitinase
MTTVVDREIKPFEQAAKYLAQANHESNPYILRTYWLNDPSQRQIRLVHVNPAR